MDAAFPILVSLAGVAVAGIGFFGVAAPSDLKRLLASWRVMTGLPVTFVIRILFGCIFLVAAAKRLSTGCAIGIDIWSQTDQADNRPERTGRNARLEGVADRVVVCDGDARKLDLPDEAFDVVV